MKVLYIDTDQHKTEIFMQNIGKGFNLLSADSLQKALDIIETVPIDCVVVNYNITEFDVIDFTKKIKLQAPRISRVLVVKGEFEHDEKDITDADIMFALAEPYEKEYLKEAVKMACLANGNDKRALFFSVSETVANKIENVSLKEQFIAQELMLRQYVDKLFEAKEIELKLERKALHIKTSKFKAVRLSWKATVVVRTVLFAVVSGVVGVYKSELTQSFLDLIHMFDE